ncbi:MAG: hypothetical protein LBC93_04350 [Synergistaceae bacterium]|nr:hypothetical protein [Synergistaceae bacterium]
MKIAAAQLEAAATLKDRTEEMLQKGVFAPARVYNPLTYAWKAFEEYVKRYGSEKKRVLFLGMNPGPWGMAQIGVPFGEVAAVREWLGISAPVERPRNEHPKYPVDGWLCKRSEVSGRRLWGLFRERFVKPEAFFTEHFVVNYCPLLFIETTLLANGKEGARNLTPDKLPPESRAALFDACDVHLRALAALLEPRFLIGVGSFAAARAETALAGMNLSIGKILHPSPASPQSNADWPGEATRQLKELGVW